MRTAVELVVVAAVALIVAGVAGVMVTGQSDKFLGFVSGESSGAKCDLWATQRDQAMNSGNSEKVSNLEDKLRNNNCPQASPTGGTGTGSRKGTGTGSR